MSVDSFSGYQINLLSQSSASSPHHKAQPLLEAACELLQKAGGRQVRQQALAAAHQGEYDQAIALLTSLIDCQCATAMDYNNRGLAYFNNGQIGLALADYNRAIQRAPGLASAYNNRANYYASQGLLGQAIQDYEQAINLDPRNLRARINQGITFRELQIYELAIECFDVALSLSYGLERLPIATGNHLFTPGHIYAERGRTYHLWGDWNCAIADYQKAIAHLPAINLSGISHSYRLYNQVRQWQAELLNF